MTSIRNRGSRGSGAANSGIGDGTSTLAVKVLNPVQWVWVWPNLATSMTSEAGDYAEVGGLAAGATLTAKVNEALSSRLSTNDLSGTTAIEAEKLCGALSVRATPIVGDRILVVANTYEDCGGIYTVTSLGSAGSKWVLTRATDFDADADQLVNAVYLEDSTGCYAVSDGYGNNGTLDGGNSNWIVVRDSTSLAAGYNSTAATIGGIALGIGAYVAAANAVAIGTYAKATGASAVAIGNRVEGLADKTIIGNFSGVAGAGGVVLCGVSAEVTNDATAVIGDLGNLVPVNKGTAVAWTIPPNVDVALPIGARFEVMQVGAGAVTVTAGAGVTLTGTKVTAGVGQVIVAIQMAANTWSCSRRA